MNWSRTPLSALKMVGLVVTLAGGWTFAMAQGISCEPQADPQIQWRLVDDFEDLAAGGFFGATVRRCGELSYTVQIDGGYSVVARVADDTGFTTLNRRDHLFFSSLPPGATSASLYVQVLDGSGQPAGATPVQLQGRDASGNVVVDLKLRVPIAGKQFNIMSRVPLSQISLRVTPIPRTAPGIYVFVPSFKLWRDTDVLP